MTYRHAIFGICLAALSAPPALADDAFTIGSATRFVRVVTEAYETQAPFGSDFSRIDECGERLLPFSASVMTSSELFGSTAAATADQSSEFTSSSIIASGAGSASTDGQCCSMDTLALGTSVVRATFTLTEARSFTYSGTASSNVNVGVQTFLVRDGVTVFNLVFNDSSGPIDEQGVLGPGTYDFSVQAGVSSGGIFDPVSFAASFDVVFEIDDTSASPWTDVGNALAGTNGAPELSGDGPLTLASTTTIALSNGPPNSFGTFIFGASAIFQPFKQGVLVPAPNVIVSGIPTDASGGFEIIAPWISPSPSGLTFYLQVWIPDAGAPAGFAASNAIQGDVP